MRALCSWLTATTFFTSPLAFAGPGQASFTPDRVQMPVLEIALKSLDDSTPAVLLRHCEPSPTQDCRVDMASESSVASMIPSEIPLPPGSYDRIEVRTCAGDSTSYAVGIEGTLELTNPADHVRRTYFTRAGDPGSAPLTTTPTQKGLALVNFSGCVYRQPLPRPLVVGAEGGTVQLGLYFYLRNLAWASLGPRTMPSGCTENTGRTQSLCASYPQFVPVIEGTRPLAFTNYLITPTNHATEVASRAGAAGQVLLLYETELFFHPAVGNVEIQKVRGGFTRPYFSEESNNADAALFSTPLRSATAGENPFVYQLENYGSSDTSLGYLLFNNFQTLSHRGTYRNQTNDTTKNYFAFADRDSTPTTTRTITRAFSVERNRVVVYLSSIPSIAEATQSSRYTFSPPLTVLSAQTGADYMASKGGVSAGFSSQPDTDRFPPILNAMALDRTVVLQVSDQTPGATYQVSYGATPAVSYQGYQPYSFSSPLAAISALRGFVAFGIERPHDHIFRPNWVYYLSRATPAEFRAVARGTVTHFERNGYGGVMNGTFVWTALHPGGPETYNGYRIAYKYYDYTLAPGEASIDATGLIRESVALSDTVNPGSPLIRYPAYSPLPGSSVSPELAHAQPILHHWDGRKRCLGAFTDPAHQAELVAYMVAHPSESYAENTWTVGDERVCYCEFTAEDSRSCVAP